MAYYYQPQGLPLQNPGELSPACLTEKPAHLYGNVAGPMPGYSQPGQVIRQSAPQAGIPTYVPTSQHYPASMYAPSIPTPASLYGSYPVQAHIPGHSTATPAGVPGAGVPNPYIGTVVPNRFPASSYAGGPLLTTSAGATQFIGTTVYRAPMSHPTTSPTGYGPSVGFPPTGPRVSHLPTQPLLTNGTISHHQTQLPGYPGAPLMGATPTYTPGAPPLYNPRM